MIRVRRSIYINVLAILIFSLFSLPALGAPFVGGTVTIDLPEGWTAGYDPEIGQILAESADKTCRVALQVADSDGLSDLEMAEVLSSQLQGTAPQKVPGFDNYYFTTNVNDMEMTITLFELGGKVLVYIEGGDTIKYERDTAQIWNSMTSSDPLEKALFDSLAKA
ncbi:hypothetical protein C4J81_08420 [Deltaproteobacteria bacterium Smac51]|nr:hypothetical protein C4J81_08420 [Deltaproteobacteria bacterium Smac51]